MVLGFRPLHYHVHLVCLTKASFCDCFQAITGVSVYMKRLLFFLLLSFFFCSFSSSFSFLFSFSFSFLSFFLLVGGLVVGGLCCVLLVGFRLFGAVVLVLFLPSSHS